MLIRFYNLILASLISVAAFAQVNLNNGLVAYYPFNGNANDASGNNNNSVFNNATLTKDYYGKPNSAYHFNGVDNYMEIPNSSSLTINNQISLCAWVKPTGFYTGPCYNNMIISKEIEDYKTGNFSLRYTDAINGCTQNASIANEHFIGNDEVSNLDSAPIKANQWYSVVYTSDGIRSKLYINCNLIADIPVGNKSYTNPYDLFLGHLDNTIYPYWLNADLDEVRIYNRPLNADEVKAYSFTCKATEPCNNSAHFAGNDPNDPGVQIGDLDIPGNKITVEASFNRADPYDPAWYGGDIVSKHTDPTDVNYLLRPTRAEITTTTGWHATPDVCKFLINKTYHVAMVYDGITLKFYRNGFLMSQTPCTGNMILNNWLTTIGSTAGSLDHNPTEFHGYINEVRIWNVARTQNEIRTYMNQSLPNPASQNGLLAYYTFDDLKNKQGNSQWDGSLLHDATINQTNPQCNFVADSCSQCKLNINAGKDVSICYKDSIQLKATGAVSYNWNTTSFLSDTSISNPIAKPKVTTNFIVTGFDSTHTCSNKDTVQVSVFALPAFTLNNDTSVCKGSVVYLNATSQNNYHYNWYPATYLSDTSVASPTSIPADTIKYYVTANDSNDCRAIDSMQISVVSNPAVSTISDTSFCAGTSVLLSTTATNANRFSWSPSSGLNNANIQNPQATPAKTSTYTLIASNVLCTTKDSVKLTVFALPDISAGNDTTICTEGIAHLHATGAVSYTWSPDINLSDTSIANPFAFPSSSTTYYVKGIDNNHCINIDSVIVYKQETPVFNISPFDSLICSGKTITLKAGGGNFYRWSPSQSLSDSASAATIAKPLTTTQYSVYIYDSICRNSGTLNSLIKVNPSPKVSVSKSNDIDCSDLTAQLHASGGGVYNWTPANYIDNTVIANPVVNPPADTKYTVTVTDTNKCTASASVLVKSTIGNIGFYVANAFTPNGDGLNDCFGLRYWGIPASFDMQIFDKWGMPVYHSKNINECWDGRYNGKKQGSGVYVYMITATSVCGKDKIFRKGTLTLLR